MEDIRVTWLWMLSGCHARRCLAECYATSQLSIVDVHFLEAEGVTAQQVHNMCR